MTTSNITRTAVDLTNARSRIVGTRDGVLADFIVALVRAARQGRTRFVNTWQWVTSVVTRLGWAAGLTIVLAFVAGYGFGWVEGAIVAWTGLALVLLALIYLIGRTNYEVSLSLPTNRVVVGEKAPGEVIVTNPGRRRLGSVRIEVPVGHGLAEFAMPSLGRGGAFEDVFLVPTPRRGVVPIGPVRTVRADPVGLVRRELVWAKAIDLFVHPRTIAIPSMSTGFIRDLEGSATRELTSSDVAFHSLREYVPGDERRNIHWKSTAKTGSYMVRQYEETKRSHLMIALSLATADYGDSEQFELAVSVAGSLGVRAIHDSRTVSVVASETTPEFAKRPVHAVRTLSTVNRGRLLDELSSVELAPTALRMPELAAVASENSGATSIVFLVCGTTTTPAQLRNASSQFSFGVSVVAVVCDSGAIPTMRRVGELNVITIGYLEDLQKSLARRTAVA